MHRLVMSLAVVMAATVTSAATVVLRVNGVGVTDAELSRARRSSEALQPGQPQDSQGVLRRAVDQVIGHALLVQAARDAGISADPAEVQRRVAAQRGRYPTQEAFLDSLRSAGLTEDELARFEEENLMIMRFTEAKVAPTATVSNDEARAYYEVHPDEFDHPEQIRVQMILISASESASDLMKKDAKRRAEKAAARLAAGEEFSRVASEMSEDATRTRGGEVGWVSRGKLLPELDKAVFALEPGKHTEVIHTMYGYHIMRAAERRPAGRSSFAEVEPTLTNMLQGNKVRELLQQIVSKRRATATIETLDPAIQAVLKPADAPEKR